MSESDKFQCVCGSMISGKNKSQHEKTKKHLVATGQQYQSKKLPLPPPQLKIKMHNGKSRAYSDDDAHDEDDEDEEHAEEKGDEDLQLLEDILEVQTALLKEVSVVRELLSVLVNRPKMDQPVL